MQLLFVIALALSFLLLDGKPPAQRGTFALTNARIETVANGTIERGTVVIRDGVIEAVGAAVPVPDDANVIDCTGLTIYPGFIDSGTRIGLTEVSSLPETRDFTEHGEVTPHMRAITAVNPNSILIPVNRIAGVTTALTLPSGGLFSGTAALINLHGYTPQQMHVGGVEAVVLNFPASGRRSAWDRRPQEEIDREAGKAFERLDEVWEQAVLFDRIRARAEADPQARTPEYSPEMEALRPVVRGELPLLVEVSAARDIRRAIEWVQENEVPRVIFGGVSEGWRVADEIAAAGIPCLIGPVLSVATRPSDRYDKPYANASLLREAGVTVAIRTMNSENIRNLPYNAGFAAAYGLGREEALRAITITPAEIFGVQDQLGSIEEGKSASLFTADGDPFETQTEIRHVFIDGYNIPMVSRQTRLYDEFINRTP